MSALMRWIQKLCPCRRQANFEEQDDGQEKEGRWEQLQDAGGREKQYQMLLNLQRTMDPWIAAQVYNNNYSPLGRLPEELLLLILYYLDNEILSIYCLGRVSRTFRRLIYEPDIWKYAFPGEYPFSLEHIWTLPLDLRSQLQQRLQKDGMCDECKLWCDAPVEGLFRLFTQACNLDTNRNRGYCTIGCFCKFESAPCRSRLYCDACGNNHDVSAFSLSNQFSTKRDRRCLGRQGAVQLCEHIHVAWTTVETHIAIWQQRKPRDWQACFGHFVIECHDPSHDTRCTAEEAPTWPRARLRTAEHYPDLVVLNLEWKPHSGLDTFTVTPDGRVPASELRSLFQKYRQGPGGIQLPSYPSSPLPEMVCFDPNGCSCLCYEMRDNKNPSDAVPSNRPNFFRDTRTDCNTYHTYYRGHGAGENGQRVNISKHWPRGTDNSVCLITTYQRDILVCHKKDRGKINPTHAWFHGMDPDTYCRPQQALPLCKDKGCMNYYRRPTTFDCFDSHYTPKTNKSVPR